ncbi:MAG: isoprenylcysteine carboxylmethyltransferase family protein [Acidobacteria bacterium]|nr:isoprenylcysteine carboxylmethyltransferase family protein [Acidobacteriota bacterium]
MSYQYLILLAVLALRLWELFYSWRRLSVDRREGRAQTLPEAVYPVIVALHAGWLAACLGEVLLREPRFQAWLVLPMLCLWGLSLALRFWVIASLGELWNVRLVERTEQPVVTAGPYAYIRHPNYLVVIVEIAAVPLMFGAYWTALIASLANGLVLWRRIAREEAYLFQFPAYREAFAHKKRLLPGLF